MVKIFELYPRVHIAKHTENELKFAVYSNAINNDLLLRDILFAADPSFTIIPCHFQRPEITNTIWEHFKSTPECPLTYLVHGLGIDLEYLRQKYVLYSPLYESGQQLIKKQGVTCLARPQELFFGAVERDIYKGLRFRRID